MEGGKGVGGQRRRGGKGGGGGGGGGRVGFECLLTVKVKDRWLAGGS